ncbi:hypothetical protein [Desulfosporosinus sp. SB140]|uniref:hypothetical protein n=1 Tax=Desulfosporosinus paludis TaxID=3115649 RepID=UPI00388F52B1
MAKFDMTRVPRRNMTPLSVNVETLVWEWLDNTYRTYRMGKGELVERALCKFLPMETLPEGAAEALPPDYFEENKPGEEPGALNEDEDNPKAITITEKAYEQLVELETLTGKSINSVLVDSIDHVYLETIKSKDAQEAPKEIELPRPISMETVEDKLAELIGNKSKKVDKELIGLHLSSRVCKLLREFKKATDVDMSDTVETAVMHLLKDFAETLD